MNHLEPAELKKRAASFFAEYPERTTVLLTPDGQAFFSESLGAAQMHARNFDGKLMEFTKSETRRPPKEPAKPKTTDQMPTAETAGDEPAAETAGEEPEASEKPTDEQPKTKK